MRRDIGFYIAANIEQVYQAYLNAATHKPFERTCSQEPLHTIAFGVNYSFKYNMNGGSCHIHLMPRGNGTAVNIRFSIAQAAGARCEKYAQDLNNAMQAFLPVTPQPAAYDVDDFMKPENQVTPATLQKAPAQNMPVSAPVSAPVCAPVSAPVSAPVNTPAAAFCVSCGSKLDADSRFCSRCGKPVAPAQKVCPNCQTQFESDAAFCSVCGTRL